MANVLEDSFGVARASPCTSRNLVVQIGTQHRSEPYQIAAKELIASGALGDISKVEIVWQRYTARVLARPVLRWTRSAKKIPTGKRWLLTKPTRPFDPRLYFEFRLYKEFSSGIPDQWMSHGIDLVHYFLDDPFPKSVIAISGVFPHGLDCRENPDIVSGLASNIRKGFCSATPPVSATTATASRASWARRRR